MQAKNLFEWSEEFSIKNIKIDTQHKQIFEIANEALELLQSEINLQNQQKLKHIILRLFDYIKTHFKEEELLMYNINFPLLKEHRKSHKNLIAKVKNMLNKTDDPKALSQDLAILMQQWILQHTINEDILITHFHKTAIDVKEIPYNIDQYNQILAANKDITKEKQHNYACACTRKTHKICHTLHIQLQKENSLIRCKSCKQPLVYIGDEINETMLENFKLKFFRNDNAQISNKI